MIHVSQAFSCELASENVYGLELQTLSLQCHHCLKEHVFHTRKSKEYIYNY